MMNLVKNAEIKRLVKAVSSNLVRAQMEEKMDLHLRNKYLESAGSDSIILGRLLLGVDKVESSKYFLSAGCSFEESGAINRSRTCYEKVIEIEVGDFIDKAIENKLTHAGIDKKDISDFIYDAINEKLENVKTKNKNKVVAEG